MGFLRDSYSNEINKSHFLNRSIRNERETVGSYGGIPRGLKLLAPTAEQPRYSKLGGIISCGRTLPTLGQLQWRTILLHLKMRSSIVWQLSSTPEMLDRSITLERAPRSISCTVSVIPARSSSPLSPPGVGSRNICIRTQPWSSIRHQSEAVNTLLSCVPFWLYLATKKGRDARVQGGASNFSIYDRATLHFKFATPQPRTSKMTNASFHLVVSAMPTRVSPLHHFGPSPP